ncbi:Outer membrane protein assembly factor YaeT precursor [hydrothermal vent metagenome]|uniref:Outer membrane protein assembly factor YaeT n=1 Tax=hydrothermal vent metagenome TaxID=652676 RepID=A0A1W1BA71_9ZZZZ
MKIALFFLILLLPYELFAYKIEKIKYDGLFHISKGVALRMLPFKEGDDVSDKEIDKALKEYYKQGYFNDIWIDYKSGELTFHFKEKPIIAKVELQGWKENDEDVLKDVIKIKKGELLDMAKLEAAKKRIIEAISQDGKIDSVVEIKTQKLENGGIKVTFIVNEGEEIIIDKLRYSGVKQLDSDEFDEVIANKEHEFMGWFWGRNDGKMHLQDLQYDPLRIRDFYMQHGFLDAKVDEPFVRVNFDSYLAQMSYQIYEGEPYKIKKIIIEQTKKVIDPDVLKKDLKLKKGEIFNIKNFRSDMERIKTKVADLSYAYVQVIPDIQKNKKKHTVKVIFRVIPGERVHIRDVIISGNKRTLDRVIRRELYLGPGDMYSLTDLQDSRHALGRLGFFDGATIEEKRIDNKSMDLIVKVKEAPTGNIQIGGGYGSYGGLLLSISVNDRNIWGSGISLGIKAEKSQTAKNASFSISNPHLNDSDFSGNFSIFTSQYDYNDYAVNSNGVTVGTGHRFSRSINGYLSYSYSSNKYDIFHPENLSTYYMAFFESYSKSSVTTTVNFDNTDDYYLPRKGIHITQSFEKAGLGADADFFKSRTRFGFYKGLEDYVGFDAIFRYKAHLYFAEDTGYLPIAERFYMGGIGSVRGYESYSLSPAIQEIDENGNITYRRVGGRQTFSNSAEISFPFVPKAKMRLVTYIDWGFIGDNNLNEISRGGYGAGLEWLSPVGPIQLMFSKAINPQRSDTDKLPADKTAVFEFTMGQRF